jgi:hypothetical protein
MIDLRWVSQGEGDDATCHLQYRHAIFYMNASGSLSPSDRWSEWTPVPGTELKDPVPLPPPPQDGP